VASYLHPIVKNAYKPFGWGVDEAVEARERSSRDGTEEAGTPTRGLHSFPCPAQLERFCPPCNRTQLVSVSWIAQVEL